MDLKAQLPDNYRSALEDDVPEGRACGNCIFFNEERLSENGEMAFCEQWEEFVSGGNYCDAWEARENESSEDDEEDEEDYSKEKLESSKPMILTFSQDVLTCNKSKRELTGLIVPFSKIGQTNMGEVIFTGENIELSENVKLFVEHDLTRPIGKMINHNVVENVGIVATFKVANTHAGDDALVEASEGLRSGFSIGAKINDYNMDDGRTIVTAAEIIEVSHVTNPAFSDAQVSEVAASADNQNPTQTERGKDMQDISQKVEAAPEVAVAASAPEQQAPVAFAKPRVNTNVSAGHVLKAQLKAKEGNYEARDLLAALEEQNTTTDSGMVPPTYLRDIIGVLYGGRPFWDSLESGTLPASGMKFYKPLRKVLATTAVTAEEAEFDSTETEIDNLEVDVVKIAGANIVSVELIDRSDPAYLDELVRQLAADWSRKSDIYAFSQAMGAPVISSGSSLYQATVKGIADAFDVMKFTPNKFLADVGNFASILGAEDQNDRPLFAAANPQNAAGVVTQGSTNGTIAGLDLVVDPNFDTGTGVEGYVYPSAAATVYQSPAFRLSSDIVANGQISIGIYGYVACAANYPNAVRAIQVTP
jgi:HK97 family phage prohead protease